MEWDEDRSRRRLFFEPGRQLDRAAREEIRTMSPSPIRSFKASSGLISTNGFGSRFTSFSAFPERVKVCQWL